MNGEDELAGTAFGQLLERLENARGDLEGPDTRRLT